MAIVAWLILPPASHGYDWDVGEVATCNSADASIIVDKKLHACDDLIASHGAASNELAVTYNSRGLWHFSKKAYELAIEDFDAAIKIDRNYAFPYNNRGLVYRQLGKFQEAIADFHRANRRSESPEHYVNLAVTFAYLGDKSGVEASLNDARKMLPNSFEVNYATCMSMALLGDRRSPVSECDLAVNASPKNPDVYDARGYANQRAGHFEAAIRDYSEALQLKPEFDTSLFGRGAAYLALGDPVKARPDITKARQINPSIDNEMALDQIKVPTGY